MKQIQLCPRCGERITPPRVALSRLSYGDDRIMVCPDCGVREAFEQYENNGVAVDWRKEK